jgi:UDP-glucose 4-epimerase
VHSHDLCGAHILTLEKIRNEDLSVRLNLGNDDGYSAREILTAAKALAGKKTPVKYSEQRAGDPDHLVAYFSWAQKILGWYPKYPSLQDIIFTLGTGS